MNPVSVSQNTKLISVLFFIVLLHIAARIFKSYNIKRKKKAFYSEVHKYHERCLLYLDIIHAFIRKTGDNFRYISLDIDEIGDCEIYIHCDSFVYDLPGTEKLLSENLPIRNFFKDTSDDSLVKDFFTTEFYSPDSCMQVKCRTLYFPFDNVKKFAESLVAFLKAQRPGWDIHYNTIFSNPHITIWVK